MGRVPDQNVIVIVVDTLRVDRLTPAGYSRPTTPGLQALADEAIFFDRFYSHSAWTRPSVATLLTSSLPAEHGVVSAADALGGDMPVLPELLRDAGFETLAFVTNPQVQSDFGFGRGFDHFEELFESRSTESIEPADLKASARAETVLKEVEQALAGKEGENPFFVYVHLIDPHGPYQPPPAWKRRFEDATYEGPISGSIDDFARLATLGGKPADVRHFSDLYDAEVAATDAAIARFVSWLKERGLLKETHLMITADHGEEFLEHGGTGHGRKLFEESIGVPLIWRGPNLPAGRRVGELAGLVDLAPTILQALDLEVPPEFRGRDLRTLLDEPHGSRALYLEELEGVDAEDGAVSVTRGVVSRRWKLIADGMSIDDRGCSSFVWYDLLEDPAESRGVEVDCARPETALEQRLLALYEKTAASFLGERTATWVPAEPSHSDREMLRSLGYVD